MAMYLYNFTLQKSSVITQAIYGNFSAPKAQEIVISRGKILELLRPDDNGQVITVLSTEVFGVIRSLLAFRLTGSNKDYIVVGSDSGRIVILEYNATHNRFDRIHEETFGRSGCRRIVPGQYLASDPKGRAVMIAAVEKMKFVYVLNRDAKANLTISSPLEAHRSHTILLSCVGVDVGFENPLFACLELDYEDIDQDPSGEALAECEKALTFYELDLGLNHMARQSTQTVPMSANMIVTVPGGVDGPGGVLVLFEDGIMHRSVDNDEVRAVIPRRPDIPPDQPVLITAYDIVKQRDWFFFLFQTEYNDLFKVWLEYDGEIVTELNVKYFDTVPVANDLAVLKTGFLFVASESSNHGLYQFQAIGEDDEDVTYTKDDVLYFKPRPLTNLLLIDEMQAAQPITDMKVANIFKEETPQIFLTCGKGPRSTLRILRHGISVSERAVSPLPGVPNAVWALKTSMMEDYDRYIVVSFKDATMVLSIGETVEEVQDTGFVSDSPTIHTSLFGEDSLIQIHEKGIRHIRSDMRIQEWQPPSDSRIILAATNSRQICVFLEDGDLIYFELNAAGQVVEIEKTNPGAKIVAMAMAPVPEGRQRARFMAISDEDNKMRIYSLAPNDCLTSVSMQVLPSPVSSLLLLEMVAYGGSQLYVTIGTRNGVWFRATLDKVTGQLSDNRARFLGSRPVKLFSITINGSPAILALSSRSWLALTYQGRFTMMPLSYVPLDYASAFCSEQCPEGIVSIAKDTLRIFTSEQYGQMFNQTVLPLRYTPRKLSIQPDTGHLLLLEGDQDCYPQEEKLAIKARETNANGMDVDTMDVETKPNAETGAEGDDDEEEEDPMPEDVFGVPRPGPGHAASCLRILDAPNSRTLDLFELGNNETVVCQTIVQFENRAGEKYLVVGTAKDLVFAPKRACSQGFLITFRLLNNASKYELVHKTPLNDIPGALKPFQGRLLVGVGKLLRIYDMGKKKLLRKCENRDLPNMINFIDTARNKIVLGDIQHSLHFAGYSRANNSITIYVDDYVPRWITAATILDDTTFAGADKFGNVFVLRVADAIYKQIEEDPLGGAQSLTSRHIVGAPHKLTLVAQFHVGEMVTQMQQCTFTPGGRSSIIYSTLSGTIGCLLPFSSREDIEFFTNLEMHLRQDHRPLCGRDHTSYRSYYAPVKGVVDGDLCEMYVLTSSEIQRKIADGLERTPAEVQKKLEDIRNSI